MKHFWFEANQFSGKVDSKEKLNALKKVYPNYQQAKKAEMTLFGLPSFGFYSEHKLDITLENWLLN